MDVVESSNYAEEHQKERKGLSLPPWPAPQRRMSVRIYPPSVLSTMKPVDVFACMYTLPFLPNEGQHLHARSAFWSFPS